MENEEIINHEIYTIKGINLYKISFTAIHNEQYDKYLKSFNKLIDTFEIINYKLYNDITYFIFKFLFNSLNKIGMVLYPHIITYQYFSSTELLPEFE
jgi:hypothetical protein